MPKFKPVGTLISEQKENYNKLMNSAFFKQNYQIFRELTFPTLWLILDKLKIL